MSESTRVPTPHVWFRERVVLHAFGLLDEADELRFREHASDCPECEAHLRAFSQERPVRVSDGGHIPARLLARWDRTRTRLRGMARRLVRAHLESCEACRQDLVVVGQTPTLEVIPALEGDDEPPSVESAAVPTPPRVIVLVPGAVPRASRWAWLMRGALAGTLATAAVFIALVLPRDGIAPPEIRMSVIPPEVAQETAALPTLEAIPALVRLEAPRRGAEPALPRVVADSSTTRLGLQLPDLYLYDNATVWLALVGPDGVPVVREKRPAADLASGQVLLLEHAPHPLQSGRYRLSVATIDAPDTPLAVFEFDVSVRGQ